MEAVFRPGEGSAAELLGGRWLVIIYGGGNDFLVLSLVGDFNDVDALLGTNDELVKLLGEDLAVHRKLAVDLEELDTIDQVQIMMWPSREPEAK